MVLGKPSWKLPFTGSAIASNALGMMHYDDERRLMARPLAKKWT